MKEERETKRAAKSLARGLQTSRACVRSRPLTELSVCLLDALPRMGKLQKVLSIAGLEDRKDYLGKSSSDLEFSYSDLSSQRMRNEQTY